MAELKRATVKIDIELDFKNVVPLYEYSGEFKLKNGIEQCLRFIDANAKTLLVDENFFNSLPYDLIVEILARDTFFAREVDICKALIRWQQKNISHELQQLLKSVRWNLISANEFSTDIRPLKAIDDDFYFHSIKDKKPERIASKSTENGWKSQMGVENVVTSHVESDDIEAPSTSRASLTNAVEEWVYDPLTRMYQCNKCRKDFASRNNIERHIRTHSDPQHICEICNKKYYEHYQLVDHLKAHQMNLACDVCGKRITLYSSFKRHKEEGKCEIQKQKMAKRLGLPSKK